MTEYMRNLWYSTYGYLMVQFRGWSIPVPWKIDVIQPELQVYCNGKDPIIFSYDEDPQRFIEKLDSNEMLQSSHFIFVTHGFENDIETAWLPQMKDAILEQHKDTTVALVGWGKGANIGILKYTQAAANTQAMGAWLADYVTEIRNHRKHKIKIWGIAHSLGAHLMGICGRTSKCLDRISALDPAGPSFEKVNQDNRLCKTDATVVDVIHTDGYDTIFDPTDWFAPVNHYGTLIPIGTVDFYPNYGYSQPGAGIFTIAGSHHRSIELYLWSIINSGKFTTNLTLDGEPSYEAPVKKTKNIDEIVEMGFWNTGAYDGNLFLKTNCAKPWVGGK